MARQWREYKTPDGSKYYYNVNTKKSTYEKPDDFDEDQNSGRKSRKLDAKPLFALSLFNDWALIICNTGLRFFHNSESHTSRWDLDDEASLELLAKLDREKLVLLVGVAKGFDPGDRNVYQELSDSISELKEDSNNRDFRTETAEESSPTTVPGQSLVSGYGSSDESDKDEDEEEEENDEGDSTEAVSCTNVPDADVDDLGTVLPEHDNSNDAEFISLFSKYAVDPYSTWNMQSRKIRDDPLFYKVTNDADRKELFENWCMNECSNQSEVPAIDEQIISSDDEDPAIDSLEPSRYHYLAHIVSKSKITSSTLPKDIRIDQKELFKQFRIKDSLSKKEQDAFLSKLLFYYKRMTPEQRIAIFKRFLEGKKKALKKGLKNQERLSTILSTPSLPQENYAIETQLLILEDCIDTHGSNAFLQEDVQYYVLGIKDKTIALRDILKDLI